MPTLLLDKDAVQNILKMADVINVVEEAFRVWGEGKGIMPAKSYLLVEHGDFRAMPAALPGSVGLKWVNAHPQNPYRNLPTVMAVMIYNDPETGYPLAVMDGTRLTAYRTGATAAIASKYLARRDSHTLGIIGAGRQAYTQILAHAEIFDLSRINVFDITKVAVERLVRSFTRFPIMECSLEEAAASDIICTLTPSLAPIIKREWIVAGTHINAVGADAEGKEELEPSLLREAMVVVDDVRQASFGGEINVPIRKGLFKIDEVYATLAEVITGQKQGRTDNKIITVFDSTGIAIEDLAVAKLVFDKAQQLGGYPSVDLVET